MPAPSLRFAAIAALVLVAALLPGPARADAEAERVALFARRFKELQRRLLMEGAERGREDLRAKSARELKPVPRAPGARGRNRIGVPRDSSELGGAPIGAPRGRVATPLGLSSLGTNVRVNNPSGDVTAAAQSEVAIGALGDNVLVAYNDGQGFRPPCPPCTDSQGYSYSTDGGQTFTDGGAPPSVSGWTWDSDPEVAVNEATGEFWYAGLNHASGQNGIGIVKATFSSGVLTWGTPRLVRAAPNNEVGLDKPWTAVDPASGRIYVAYTAFSCPFFCAPHDTILIQSSGDGGVSWSDPVQLSDLADDGYVQGARVAIGTGGEVYVTWYVIGRSAPYTDYFPVRKSTNGGVSFAPPVNAAAVFANFGSGAPGFNRGRGVTFPTLAVDRSNGPHRGRVYVGWNESIDFYTDNLGTAAAVTEAETNDTPATANAFALGDSVRALLGPGETDFFKFTATQGQTAVLYLHLDTVGNIPSPLEMSLRLLCADGNTQLAFCDPGDTGLDDLIVFTIPTTGTYYVRCKGIAGSASGYTIYSGVHAANPLDRARDHRDVFVTHSDDAVVWSVPKRVNNDPAYLDNWLPELAVSNLSTVYAAWYDWRDASSGICNAVSQVYLASSSDGGDTWSTLGAMSDAASDWTDWNNTKANIAPNQGDYIALFADCQAVYGSWGDVRDPDVNTYLARYPPLTQPTLVTFSSALATPHQVDLTWQAQGAVALSGTVERRDLGGAWAALGPAVNGAGGQLTYLDATVSPGASYEYRLSIPQPPLGNWLTCGVQVDVPVEILSLSLGRARPNPTDGDIIVSFDLPSNAPATLKLMDLSGREIHAIQVGPLGPGRQTVNLGAGLNLRPGLYFVQLRQRGQDATVRVSVVR